MKIIIMLSLVFYCHLNCMAIELKTLREKCVVKSADGWYLLRTNLIWFDEYPELQKELTKILFDCENTSIKQGYSKYVNSFQSIKDARDNMKKADDKEIQILLRLTTGLKGRYMSLIAERKVISKKPGTISPKSWGVIFDETNGKILRAKDIFTEEYQQQHLQDVPDNSLSITLTRDYLTYSYIKNGQLQNHDLSLSEADNILSSDFKQLIKFDNLSFKAAEREIARQVIALQDVDTTKIYDKVEQMPEFPGGQLALNKFILEHYKYPETPFREGISGNVIVTFVVERDGSISQGKIVKAVEPHLDKEALRLVRKFPRWKPGKQHGVPVRVLYTYPFQFRLYPRD